MFVYMTASGLCSCFQAMPGVQDFVTAKDVMGSNDKILMGQFVSFFAPFGLDSKMVPTDQVGISNASKV